MAKRPQRAGRRTRARPGAERPPHRRRPPGTPGAARLPDVRPVGDRDRRRARASAAAGRPRQHLPHPRRARAPAPRAARPGRPGMARYEPIRSGEDTITTSCATAAAPSRRSPTGPRAAIGKLTPRRRCASPSTRSCCAAPARSAPPAEGTAAAHIGMVDDSPALQNVLNQLSATRSSSFQASFTHFGGTI